MSRQMGKAGHEQPRPSFSQGYPVGDRVVRKDNEMTDTKALDHFFDNGNWQSGDDGDWQYEGTIDPQQAAAELAELKRWHEIALTQSETIVRLMEDKKDLAEMMVHSIAERAQLRKDLEEARAENGKLSALLAEKYEIYLQNCAEIDQLNIELEAMFQATVSVLGDDEHRGHTTKGTLELCRNTVYAYVAAHPSRDKEPK